MTVLTTPALTPEQLFAAHQHRVLPYVRLRRRQRGYPPQVGIDELLSAALEGLWHAARRYQPERSSFWTYACRRMAGSIADYLRSIDQRGRRRKRCPPLRRWGWLLEDGVAVSEEETIPDASASLDLEHLEQRDEVEAALQGLTPRTRQMVVWHYLEHVTMEEIGRRMGCCTSQVSLHLTGLAAWLSGRWQVRTRSK